MPNALSWITSLAPVVTALIAFTALWSWQRQDKAKREAEFLDELVEAALTYMADLSVPITTLGNAKIGMVSHARKWEPGTEDEIAAKGAIAFIQQDGERVGKRLSEALEKIRPSVVTLKSRSAKGQVFSFEEYDQCRYAVQTLTRQFDRMEWLAAFISSRNWIWEAPEVQDGLKNVMSTDADEMRATVQNNFAVLMEFVRVTYQRIYGRWWTRQRPAPEGARR